jgi:hypothetical protein
MLLADVTFIFLAQCPLLRTVSLEVSQERVIIIFNPLVEYKLRVIYEPGYDELIDFVIV